MLDNADDPGVDYQQYLPTGPWGVVVLTSRNQACDVYATAKSIFLDGLTDAEACELLMRAAKIPQDQRQTLEDDARKVATLLRSHPLALIQAGSYIARGHSTIDEYPRIFAAKRQRLLAFHPTQAQSRYKDVYATFEASAEILQSTGTEAATDALDLLPVLATFDSNRLPLSLFEAGLKRVCALKRRFNTGSKDDADDNDNLRLTQWLIAHLLPLMQVDADQWDSFRLVEAIDLLKSFSLVSTDTHSGFLSVSMHPLVHAWARDRQDSEGQNSSWIMSGCIMALSWKDRDFWLEHGRQLRPHLHAFTAWDTSNLFVCHPPKQIACILLACGWLLFGMQDTMLVNSLTQRLFSNLGLDMDTIKIEWLHLYALVADNLQRDGRLNTAIMLLNRMIRLQEEKHPADHPDLLSRRHDLAVAYQDNGQSQEAITLLERVVKDRETLKEDHPDRLHSQHGLAGAYHENGQVQEALTLLEQVVKIRDQTLRENHLDLLASRHNLATYYWDLGRRETAFEMMAHVVKILQQVLPEHHPERIKSEEWLEDFQEELNCTEGEAGENEEEWEDIEEEGEENEEESKCETKLGVFHE